LNLKPPFFFLDSFLAGIFYAVDQALAGDEERKEVCKLNANQGKNLNILID
jgi:hypothetical protein